MYLGATELDYPAGVSVGTNTIPLTIDSVATLISEYEGQVNGIIAAAGYEVPISTTATYAFAATRKAVRDGVMGAVLNTFFPNMGSPKDSAASLASQYQRAYDQFRASLKSGDLTLVGALKAGEDDGRVLPRSGGLASARMTYDVRF